MNNGLQISNRKTIGMACVYPGAHSPEKLWQNVLAGRRFFHKMPPERLPRNYFDPDPTAPGKSYCNLAAVITNWTFDPLFPVSRKSLPSSGAR